MGTWVICKLYESIGVIDDCNSAERDKICLSCKQPRSVLLNICEFHVMTALLSHKYRSGRLVV